VKIGLHRLSATAVVLGLFTLLSSGCVVPGGYGYDGSVGVGVDYYEPFGAVYGGWGPGYHVAPGREGYRRPDGGGGGHASAHAFRSAPSSRLVPSIPSRSRSGSSKNR
jgi:hypothetical protein